MGNRCTGLVVAIGLSGGVCSTAAGDVIEFGQLIDFRKTNWTEVLTFPKFDPNLGFLDKVEVELLAVVNGNAAYENLDAREQVIRMFLRADVTVRKPDSSLLVAALPEASTEDLAGPFDGIIDFGGTSGKTYPELVGLDDDFFSSTDAGDLAQFTGPGDIDLTVRAVGASRGTGAGNLALRFMTKASAEVLVRYHYTIPAPGGVAVLALAGVLVCGSRRRRGPIGA